jgi:hypothetical protein
LRIFYTAAALAMLLLPQAGHSQENTGAEPGVSGSTKLSPADQAIKSDAMAKAARDKSDALERSRDRKMRAISKGICTGC